MPIGNGNGVLNDMAFRSDIVLRLSVIHSNVVQYCRLKISGMLEKRLHLSRSRPVIRCNLCRLIKGKLLYFSKGLGRL